MGIEPTLFAWEAKVLPLNYTRVVWILKGNKTPWRIFKEARIYSRGCATLRNRDGMQGGFCSKYRDICKKTNAADRPNQVIARHANKSALP